MISKNEYYDFLKSKKVKGSLSSLKKPALKKLALENGFIEPVKVKAVKVVKTKEKQVELSNVKNLKLGKLIINIHNSLGGQPNHPYIEKVAKIADVLNETKKQEILEELKPHIEKAKKYNPVITTKPLTRIEPEVLSEKAQGIKEQVEGELKKIKKSGGMDSAFKNKLEGIFGRRPPQ